MNWTEPSRPTKEIPYDHVLCETPLGTISIEWKGWKEMDTYGVIIGNEYIGDGWDLEDAKKLAKEWLVKKHNELSAFLTPKLTNVFNEGKENRTKV